MPGRKMISPAARKKWILGCLVLALLVIILGGRYGQQLSPKNYGPARPWITGPATSQSFDGRLSLKMPVAFGSPTELPLEKLPVEAREKIQKLTQRTAYFNGVFIVVMKITNTPGTQSSVEKSLYNAFAKNSNAPLRSNMPRIDSTFINGVCESGVIRFPAVFGNRQGQMTAVVIKSGTEDSLWYINAWGTGKAAALAEKTAREFAFN